jgi:hypothetical protein
MSTQQPATYGAPAVPAKPSKPATLAIGFWLSVVVGVLSILGPIFTFALGKDSVRAFVQDEVSDQLGTDVPQNVLDLAIGESLDEAYGTLVTKAVVGLVVGVIILALAFVARNGSMGGRITLAVFLAIGMCAGSGLQFVDIDVLPGPTVLTAALTPLLSLVAIVMLFLPASNGYAKAVKAAG